MTETEGKITVGYKIKNHRKVSNSLIALPVLGLAAIAATVAVGATDNVNADTCPASTCSDTTTVTVNVGAVISLSTPDKITVNMSIPTTNGTFASGTGEVGVSTNDSTGYSVYLTGTNGGNTNLTHESVSSSKFATLSAAETVASGGKFATANTWGWTEGAGGTTYYPLQAYNTQNTAAAKTRFIYKSASTIGKNTCTVNPLANYECSVLKIGATGNTSLTAGTYTGTILVTAVPNSYDSISDYDTDRP